MPNRFQRYNTENKDGGQESYVVFECPGCNMAHSIQVVGAAPKPVWKWNGDLEHATFSPSLRVEWTHGPNHEPRKCHSFVVNGRIKFLGDCTHTLAGKTVDVPEVENGS